MRFGKGKFVSPNEQVDIDQAHELSNNPSNCGMHFRERHMSKIFTRRKSLSSKGKEARYIQPRRLESLEQESIALTWKFFLAVLFACFFGGTILVFAAPVPSVDLDNLYVANIPFIAKKPDFGGEACLAMFLRSKGFDVDQDYVFDSSNLDPLQGRGCHTKELVTAAHKMRIDPGPVWHSIRNDQDLFRLWKTIKSDLAKRQPTIVCRLENRAEQFVLVVGYDAARDEVIFHDPNHSNGKDRRLGKMQFLQSCSLSAQPSDDGRELASFIGLRLSSDRLKVGKKSAGYTDADYAQHILKLKKRLPHAGFHIEIQKPFVVVGDGTPNSVKQTSVGTVKWAVDAIKKDYFSKDPYHIIDVWLFKDPKSYKKHNLELFDTEPGTPYGYYSPSHRVLVMDISTGGGTLVHEIVHPFMESNFPACPSWFNEGLASLYEQSSTRNGHIIGLTNWRLRGLQYSIEDDRLPTFKELCSTTTGEFYNGHSTNYAQARYLCYYLQERGSLIKYYHAFRKNAVEDPGGYETLKRILNRSDIEKFQEQWEGYVMKLRFQN